MSLGVGKMTELITRETVARTDDGFSTEGGETWTADDNPIWAEITGLEGQEFYAAQGVRSEQAFTVKIHYLPGLTTDDRFTWGSLTLRIEAVDDEGQRHEWHICRCRAWTAQ